MSHCLITESAGLRLSLKYNVRSNLCAVIKQACLNGRFNVAVGVGWAAEVNTGNVNLLFSY